MKTFTHIPVLLKETIDGLDVLPNKKYIDATLGGAGHTQKILEQGGIVLGIDQDSEALEYVSENLKFEILNLKLKVAYGNFRNIESLAKENGFEKVYGILFDLGVSSHQLDSKERGFSIKHDAPLDMRMDKTSVLTASEIVNTYSESDLADIFMEYGEEDNAGKIAAEIIDARNMQNIETSGELIKVIEKVVRRTGKLHPATKVFQALRIEVNQELDSLKRGLEGALKLLEKDGRIVVISFHSLEDRIVKRTFDKWQIEGFGEVFTKKLITAGENELLSNPRARSAKLRVFKKS